MKKIMKKEIKQKQRKQNKTKTQTRKKYMKQGGRKSPNTK